MKKHIPVTLVFLMFFMIGAKPDLLKPGKGVTFTQTNLAHAIQLAKAQKKKKMKALNYSRHTG